MAKAPQGYSFYTERASDGTGEWVGRCKELPQLKYQRLVRDTALSGVKRMVASHIASQGTSISTQTHAPSHAPGPVPAINVLPVVVNVVPPAAPVVATKKLVNLVAFVLDRSGSMAYVMKDAISALNNNIKTLRDESAKTGQKTLAAVIAFNSGVNTIRYLQSVDTIQSVTYSDVSPAGGTALMDATTDALSILKSSYTPAFDEDVAYMVMTITDGEENQSHRQDKYGFSSMIKSHQALDNWTFTFLVPPAYKASVVRTFGLHDGNVMEWAPTKAGVQAYEQATNQGLGAYYSARSVGTRSVSTFYANTDNLSNKVLDTNLTDIRTDVKTWTVPSEAAIRDFCEKNLHGAPYLQGAAFYQLNKTEKVQANKQIIIVDRNTGATYAGSQARSLLNLPHGQLIKLAPGSITKFDVFVQSTSVNRKLFPGSRVVYYARAVQGPTR